jgi:predicted nucleotidyltransferase
MSRETDALCKIADEKGVDILYAVESGSRAWGFASPDSDYDIRFIYVHPRDQYLRLDQPQDTIERIEGDLDIAGWDIFKALRLLRKSNPPLMEWLFSPMVYTELVPYIDILRQIAHRNYSSSAVFYHYSRMAHRNYRQYIANKIAEGATEVPTKKYLYVIRPIIALLYLEQHHALPPTHFLETLRFVELDNDTRNAILELVNKKIAGFELGMDKPIPALNTFAEQHLNRWLQHGPEEQSKRGDFRALDDIVWSILEGRHITTAHATSHYARQSEHNDQHRSALHSTEAAPYDQH